MTGDEYLWPYNPASSTPSKQIDWISVKPSVMKTVKRPTVRKVHRDFLVQLKDRFPHLWESMDDGCREAALALIEARRENKDIEQDHPEDTPKERINKKLKSIQEEAEAGGDLQAQIKIVELDAKLYALLSNKPEQVDPIINIFVNTGVNRGNA